MACRQTCVDLVAMRSRCARNKTEAVFAGVSRVIETSFPGIDDISSRVPDTERVHFITRVLDDMFDDGVYNWGRVVTAIMWASRMASPENENLVGGIVADKIAQWVESNGGFDTGFVEFFGE